MKRHPEFLEGLALFLQQFDGHFFNYLYIQNRFLSAKADGSLVFPKGFRDVNSVSIIAHRSTILPFSALASLFKASSRFSGIMWISISWHRGCTISAFFLVSLPPRLRFSLW